MSGPVKLYLVRQKKSTSIAFHFPKNAEILASGIGVEKEKFGQAYPLVIVPDAGYKLMLSMASDSADNFVIYSAYAFLPDIAKWKLIGTCKLTGYISSLQKPGAYVSSTKKDTACFSFKDIWVQRVNGSWKSIDKQNMTSPTINLLSHADSIPQIAVETSEIEKAIAAGKTDATQTHKGLYYHIMNEGTGKMVQPTDTVKIFYKGYLFNDGTIFDQTKDSPRSFPLNRLIQGWQIGLPLLKTGGKIKLVIPSHLAYSIRTRAPKIPPNSTLVFEIEVVDATPVK
jgi:FKBP-type peptidyl-prolyl cis-trans isomerase